MKTILSATGFFCGCLLLAGTALSETLPEILRYTYENGLSITAERESLKATDEIVSQAKSGYRPQIAIEGSAGRAYYDNTSSISVVPIQKQHLNPQDISVSLVQPVFSGLSTYRAVESAKEQVKANRSDLRHSEQNILLEAAGVYMDVIRDRAVFDLQKNNEKVLRKHLDSYRKRFKAGDLTRTDVTQAEARWTGATAHRIDAEGQVEVSKARFFSVVGLEANGLQDIQAFGWRLPETLDEAILLALAQNPQILAAESAYKAAGSATKSKKGALAPAVNLNLVTGHQKEQVSLKESDYWQVMAHLKVPLYQSGAEFSQIRQAKHTENQYRILRAKIAQDVQSETISAWKRHQAVRAQRVAMESQIKASQVALEGVIREANVGARTVLDVLDAEQEHLDNRVSFVTVRRDEIVSAFQLLAVIGQLNPEYLELGIASYDPKDSYEAVKNKWWGY